MRDLELLCDFLFSFSRPAHGLIEEYKVMDQYRHQHSFQKNPTEHAKSSNKFPLRCLCHVIPVPNRTNGHQCEPKCIRNTAERFCSTALLCKIDGS